MATMNQTYLHVYDILDNAEVLKAKLQFTLENLGRNKELVRKMEVAESFQVEEFAKIWDENEELKHKLLDSQVCLQAWANDHTTITTKVSVVEARARAAKERAA